MHRHYREYQQVYANIGTAQNVLELHQDFSERYPYARSSEETTEKHCGQIDNITFEATRKRNYL